MTATLGTGDHKDFDETRRLLYMALLAPRTKRYSLAGTLVNALVHHHAVDGVTAEQAADHVIRVIEQHGSVSASGEQGQGDSEASRAWLLEQIDRITAERKDGPVSS